MKEEKVYCKDCKHIDDLALMCGSEEAIASIPLEEPTPNERAYGKRLAKQVYWVNNLRFNGNNNCKYFSKKVKEKKKSFWKRLLGGD